MPKVHRKYSSTTKICSVATAVHTKIGLTKKNVVFILISAIICFGIRKILHRWFGERVSLPNRGTAKRRLPVRV